MLEKDYMDYIKTLEFESNQVINLRIKNETWDKIKKEYGNCIYDLRKSNTYIRCVSETIKKIGLNYFRSNCIRKDKSIAKHLCHIFGVSRQQTGELMRRIDYELYYSFEQNLGGRSEYDSIEFDDCVVRNFVLCFGITYDESKKLCISNRVFNYEKNPLCNGVSDWTIRKVFRSKEWDYLKNITQLTQNKINLNDLLFRVPELKKERMSILTKGHIFYIDKGVIKDTWDDGFTPIDFIFASVDRIESIERIITDVYL